MTRDPCPSRRHGAALVETAAVLMVFLLLLFGVLEYCRFLFIRELVANAAREGVRYAVVNTARTTLEADTRAQVLKFMNGFDGKVKNFVIQVYHGDSSGNKIYSYDSAGSAAYGYQTDGTGNYLVTSADAKVYISNDTTGPYVLNGSTKVCVNLDTTTGGISGVDASAWSAFTSANQIKGVDPAANAPFGEPIVVQIDCDYEPILPSLIRLGNTIHIRVRGLMNSEAN